MTNQHFLLSWDRSYSAPLVEVGFGDQAWQLGTNQTKCVWSIGFIANRSELMQHSNLSESASDPEILLYLYLRYGDKVAERIAGPFSWIVWDADRQELIAARDRIGNHGIFHLIKGQNVYLSTQVELLLPLVPTPCRLNPRSIVAQINILAPLDGETFYEGVNALAAGKVLVVARDGIQVRRYWRVDSQPALELPSDADYADVFRELFFRVMAEYAPPHRMGVTLSSGMDSSSVAAAMKAIAPNADLTSVSWITPELPDSDEGPFTSAVSEFVGLSRVTIRADLHWPLRTSEEPKTSVATPSYNVYAHLWSLTFAAAQQSGVGTLFSGISGDHLFGGDVFVYPDLLLTGRWLELARQICTNLPYSGFSLPQLIRFAILGPIRQTYFPFWRRRQDPVPWLGKDFRSTYSEYFAPSDKPARMLPGRKQRLDLLRDPLLPHSILPLNLQAAEYDIDLRHPLADHRLIEFAAGLPTSQTYRAAVRKIIVRNAMRGYLPNEVVDLDYKVLPGPIVHRGLKEREQAKVWKLITNMRAAEFGFVDEKCLQENYRAYLNGKHENAQFWFTLALEDWLRRYF